MRRNIMIAALLGAVLAALGTVVAASSAESQQPGRIVFEHDVFRVDCCAVAGNIDTMNPDGSDLRQLTNNGFGAVSEDPAWGKNGWIYFDSGPADGLDHLYRMNANGRAVTQITSGDGSECCVSPAPDGHLLAFDGFFPAVAPDGAQGIYVTDAHGGSYADFRRLTTGSPSGFDTAPDISPDGRTIAFRRVVDDTAAAVFVVGVDGRGLRQVTPYAVEAGPPQWSPDGRRIVFGSGTLTDFDNAQVWVVDADGTGLTQLTHGTTGNPSLQPAWSPDGTQIVFTHFLPTGFFTQQRVMNADGTGDHVIHQGTDFTLDVRSRWGDARGAERTVAARAGSELPTSPSWEHGAFAVLTPGTSYRASHISPTPTVAAVESGWSGTQVVSHRHGKTSYESAAFLAADGEVDVLTGPAMTLSPAAALAAPRTRIPHWNFAPYAPPTEVKGVRIAGLHGLAFDGTAPPPGVWTLVGSNPPELQVVHDRAFRMIALRARGRTVVIVVQAPAAGFATFLPRAERLLSSLRFAAGH